MLDCYWLCWDVRWHHVSARIKGTTCPPPQAEDADSLWTLASIPPIINVGGMCMSVRAHAHARTHAHTHTQSRASTCPIHVSLPQTDIQISLAGPWKSFSHLFSIWTLYNMLEKKQQQHQFWVGPCILLFNDVLKCATSFHNAVL